MINVELKNYNGLGSMIGQMEQAQRTTPRRVNFSPLAYLTMRREILAKYERTGDNWLAYIYEGHDYNLQLFVTVSTIMVGSGGDGYTTPIEERPEYKIEVDMSDIECIDEDGEDLLHDFDPGEL